MSEITSFQAIIALWPSLGALAADVGAPVTAVTKWGQRNNIPAEWWLAILATERAKALGLTSDVLARLASREEARA